MTKEEFEQAFLAIEKLKKFVSGVPEKGAIETLCGYCMNPLGSGRAMPLESQNPNCPSYCMDCMQLDRAYEHMFATRRLLDGAPMLAKSYLKSELEKAKRHFVEEYVEYVILRKIKLRNTYLDRMCEPYGGYVALVQELDERRRKDGWPRLIKEGKNVET